MVKERKTELVEGFRHSVPYINTHRGKTFVIMLGGEAIEHENFSSIVNDIGLLHSLGIRLVVVYGSITRRCRARISTSSVAILLLPSRWASMTAWITAIAGVSGGLMKTRSIVNWTAVQ